MKCMKSPGRKGEGKGEGKGDKRPPPTGVPEEDKKTNEEEKKGPKKDDMKRALVSFLKRGEIISINNGKR